MKHNKFSLIYRQLKLLHLLGASRNLQSCDVYSGSYTRLLILYLLKINVLIEQLVHDYNALPIQGAVEFLDKKTLLRKFYNSDCFD